MAEENLNKGGSAGVTNQNENPGNIGGGPDLQNNASAGGTSTKPKEIKKDDKDDLVQVSRQDLKDLMDRLEKQTKDIDLLYKASDKSRLAKALGGGGDVLVHTAKVSKWDRGERYVIAWKLETNRCEIIGGKWVEEQSTVVVFDEGEPVTVPLLEFYRKIIEKDEGEIISREQFIDKATKTKEEMLTIEFSSGKKLKINSKYVN